MKRNFVMSAALGAVLASVVVARAQVIVEDMGTESCCTGVAIATVRPMPPMRFFFAFQGDSRSEELYRDGTNYLNEGDWGDAIKKFDEVASLKGERAGAALYWKAYAQNKLGQKQEALETIDKLHKTYPDNKWMKDAQALQLEIKRASGQKVDPQAQSDEELKLLALNGLIGSDPSKAIPALQKILMSNNSTRVKDRALFVLAQSDSPEAQKLLTETAKTTNDPDVQRRAVMYLSTQATPEHMAALGEIYRSSTNVRLKKSILESYVACGCQKELFAVAEKETDPELRRHAIQMLAALGDSDGLHKLYREASSSEEKRSIIQSLSALGDTKDMAEIARTSTDEAVRSAAIDGLTAMGDVHALVQLYPGERDVRGKTKIIDGLTAMGAAKELIDIDRKETNPELHRKIVERLSAIGSPEAKEYMIELLNK
jgi:HEAT repeat protein